MTEEENVGNEKEEFHKGLGYTVVLHIIFASILYVLFLISDYDNVLALIPIFFIGISQLVYMIPAILIAQGKGRPQFARGFVVGAAVTFLLNAACTGYLWLSNRG
jgi:hypothetical protein